MTDLTESKQTKTRFRILRENRGLVKLVSTVALCVVVVIAVSVWVFPSPQRQLTNMGISVEEYGNNPWEKVYRRFYSNSTFKIRTDDPNDLSEKDLIKAIGLVNQLDGKKKLVLHSCADIETLRPLQDLKNYTQFSVRSCNNLKTLDGLRCHYQLYSLSCGECPQLANLNTNTPLATVSSIHISFCPELEDYSALSDMVNLRIITLRNGKTLPDFSKLQHLTKLRSVWIKQYEQFSDVKGIETLTHLEKLRLQGHSISQTRLDEIQRALPNTIITSSVIQKSFQYHNFK